MAEAAPGPWYGRATYAGLASVLLAAPLLPLSVAPLPWASPDLLLAVTFAWAARRPDALPVLGVAGVFLLADLLFQRPPGLHAALVIMATEWLRARAMQLRKGSLLGEWAAVASAVVLVTAADRVLLALAMTPQAQLGLAVVQAILTIAVYPAVATLAHLTLGLRRPAQGEADARGHLL